MEEIVRGKVKMPAEVDAVIEKVMLELNVDLSQSPSTCTSTFQEHSRRCGICLPGNNELCTGIWIPQQCYECRRPVQGYSGDPRAGVSDPVSLPELWGGANEDGLAFKFIVLVRQCTCLANGCAIVIAIETGIEGGLKRC